MARNIHYVTCPRRNGEFYVTKSFFEVKGARCYCPFCTFEFKARTGQTEKGKKAGRMALPLFLGATLLASLLWLVPTAFGQQYPARPITLTVGMAAGGVTDLATRTIAEEAKKLLKQEVLVVNKPGAGQTVAMSELALACELGARLGG